MSGEMRLVRGALIWGTLAVVPLAGILFLVRGRAGSLSLLIAAGIVLANAGASAAISAAAGRSGKFGAAMIAMPSFAIRMAAIAAILVGLSGRDFIDKPVFALSFGTSLFAVLLMEARVMRRTPWLALTFYPKEQS